MAAAVRTSAPQPQGHVDVSDHVRQSDGLPTGLVEMFRQQLSPMGGGVHVVFY